MRNAIKIPLIILAAVLGVILLLIGLGAAFYFSTSELEVSAADKALIIGPDTIKPYFEDYEPKMAGMSVRKVKYIDGQVELEMEYDVEDLDHPYLSVIVTDSRRKAEAWSNYLLTWNAMVAVYNAYDSKYDIVEDDSVLKLGDRSRFAYIKYEDNIVGNMILFLVGNNVYQFTMTGFYIDDAEIWQELFDGKVEQLAAFNNP